MFGSNSKHSEYLRPRKNDLSLIMNDSPDRLSRSFIPPKITSTPLRSNIHKDIFATPPKPHLFTPKKYALSEIATPPRQERLNKSTKYVSSGPLLASTKYSLSVSTYEDAKSPGLASRVVQYNEEVEKERKHQPTHQERYGSPGLFPIVHLFKKKPPSLYQMPKSVNVRVHSPDRAKNHSEEYNRKLLEEIVRPVSSLHHRNFNHSNERSTRSVLDALKEISRKRIHPSEEFDLEEDSGKRSRTEILNNGVDSNKRQRDDSSFDKSGSPNKQTAKKVCVYDEYAASCSSMDFSTVKKSEAVSKRKNTSTSTETSRDLKALKLVNVETQTIPEEDKPEHPKENQQDSTEVNETKTEEIGKVISNVPLEVMRKNRLSALIGTLSGKESDSNSSNKSILPTIQETKIQEISIKQIPSHENINSSQSVEVNKDVNNTEKNIIFQHTQLIPKPVEPKPTEKPLVSILTSSKNSSPAKHEKHVHFSIPETHSVTQTSTSIATPIVSTAVSDTPQFNMGPPKLPAAPPSSPTNSVPNTLETALTISFPASVSDSTQKTTASTPLFQFNRSFESQPMFPKSSAKDEPHSSPAIPTINFGLNTPKPASNSPPKLGGFKFDLSKPAAVPTATSSIPPFSFGNKKSDSLAFAIVPPSTTISNSFGAVAGSSATPTTTNSSFGAIVGRSAASPATVAPSNSFTFTKPEILPETPKIINKFNFGATSKPADLSFGVSTSSPSKPNFILSKSPTFKFGGNSITSTSQSVSSSVASTMVVNNFGSSASIFGTSTTKPIFSLPSSITATTAPSSFDISSPFNKNANSFGQPPTESGFGSSNTFSPTTTTSATFPAPQSNSFKFSAPTNTSNMFGTPKTTASSFVTPTTSFGPPSFGNPIKPTFANASNTTNSMFGTVPQNTQAPAFPNQTPFGVPNTTSPFGTNTTTTTTTIGANSFGGGQPTFNFGSKSGASTFGSNNSFGPVTTTSNSIFGNTTTTTTSFGATNNAFGNTTAGGFAFGNNNSNPPAFGATTTAPPAFGSNTAPVIQPSGNVFGAPAAAGSSFNSSSAPAFGSTSAGFGSVNNTSFGGGFGSSGSSAFGKPQTSNAFGSSAPAFRSNSNAQPQVQAPFGQTNAPLVTQASSGFNFGGATPKPTFSFGAGTSGEAPKPTFNFTGGSANPPVFGSSGGASTSFGGVAPPAFGAPQFNAPTGAAGVFNIGSGSTSRPRTKLQGKRRT